MRNSLRALVAALTVAATALSGAAPALAEGSPSGSLEGKILAAAGGPVEGAVVLVRSLEDASEHSSDPSDAEGAYALGELPAGRYEIAVRTGKGLYLGARSIRVTELGRQSYSFRIEDRPRSEILSYAETEDADEEGDPGEDKDKEKKKRKGAGAVPGISWWDNPLTVVAAGLAFVVGTGALIEAVDDENDDEDSDGSPSGP